MVATLKQNTNAIFSGFFFFMVLFSLFVMRPFRSAIAAQIGTEDLTKWLFSKYQINLDMR